MANTSLTQPAEARLRLKALLEGQALGRPALIYLILISLAEAITNLSVPQTGLALHGVILCLLLVHASLAIKWVARRFLVALALAPLIRLLSRSMPLAHFPFMYRYIMVGGPLFLAAFTAARASGMHRGMLGLNARQLLNARRLPLQLLVASSGLGLGYLEYRIFHPDPLAAGLRLELIWLPALILLVFTGFLEELIFRGLMQYTALRGLGLRGLYYVAAVFAVLHIGYRSVLDMIFVFAVAVYFGWVAQRSSSLLGVTLAHGLTNIGLFLIFPFLVGQPNVTAPAPQELMAPPARVWTATPRATFTPAPSHTPTAQPSPTPTNSPPAQPRATPAPSATIEACQLRAGMTIFVPPNPPTAVYYPNPTPRPAQTHLPTTTKVAPRPTQGRAPTATHVSATQAPISAPPTPTSPPLPTTTLAPKPTIQPTIEFSTPTVVATQASPSP